MATASDETDVTTKDFIDLWYSKIADRTFHTHPMFDFHEAAWWSGPCCSVCST